MTTMTDHRILTEADASADLKGLPRPHNMPPGGRVTVERMLLVSAMRDAGNGMANGGCCSQPVAFCAERFDTSTQVNVRVTDDTSFMIELDALVEITAALCPPWLLRKKLGL